MNLLRLIAFAAFLPLLAHGASFPYVTFNGHTNRLTDNGTALTYNGVVIGGSSGNWTASGTTNSTLAGLASAGGLVLTNSFQFGTLPYLTINSDGSLFSATATWDSKGLESDYWSVQVTQTNDDWSLRPAALNTTILDGGGNATVPGASFGYYAFNFVNRTNTEPFFKLTTAEDVSNSDWGVGAEYFGTSDYGGGISGGSGGSVNGIGVQGWSLNHTGYSIGVAGMTKITGTNQSGGFFAAYSSSIPVPKNSAVVVADVMDSGLPVMIGAASGTQVFQVANSGAVLSSSSYTSGAPSDGTAAPWKFGGFQNGYVEAEVGGVSTHLAVAATPLAVSYSSGITVNFASTPLLTTILTGSTAISASNQTDGATIDYEFRNSQSTNVNVVLPSTWKIQSGAVTNILSAGATATLSMRYYAFITNTVALWASE